MEYKEYSNAGLWAVGFDSASYSAFSEYRASWWEWVESDSFGSACWAAWVDFAMFEMSDLAGSAGSVGSNGLVAVGTEAA